MLLRAADELDLDLGQSVMIGDSEGDVLAAQAAGCQPVLVKTGLGGEHLARLGASGLGNFRVAESLSDAAVWVRDHVVKRAGSATA